MEKVRRLGNLLKSDGRTLIVAMDHGTNAGAPKGLVNPAEAIEKVKAGGADAVIVNYGIARQYAKELIGLGLILRVDIAPTMLGQGHDSTLIFSVKEALRLGADAVIVNGGPGVGVEEKTLPNIANIVAQCAEWGMPVIGEMSPGGFDSAPEIRTLENIKLGARIACELGCDMVKTIFKPGFKEVVEACPIPVVVLGGAKTNDDIGFLASIKDALDEGAAGVAIGRNVWGHSNPEKMTRALKALIHQNATLEEAVGILKG